MFLETPELLLPYKEIHWGYVLTINLQFGLRWDPKERRLEFGL